MHILRPSQQAGRSVINVIRRGYATQSSASASASSLSSRSASTASSAAAKKEYIPSDGKKTVGYVLHGKFTNNNTVLTLSRQYCQVGKLAENMTWQEKLIDSVRPKQEVVRTISSGQLGFRGTKKNSYEASFQTSVAMFKLMEEKLLGAGGSSSGGSNRLEIVFRNFGEGREAFLNVLNGKEGTKIRDKVYRVTDGSKVRFGGDRPPGRRRV